MDGHRFDGLTRALSSGVSRRQALTVLGAALAGSGLLAALSEETSALSRKAKRRCRRAGGMVCNAGTKRACCSPSGECLNGACVCSNDCPTTAPGNATAPRPSAVRPPVATAIPAATSTGRAPAMRTAPDRAASVPSAVGRQTVQQTPAPTPASPVAAPPNAGISTSGTRHDSPALMQVGWRPARDDRREPNPDYRADLGAQTRRRTTGHWTRRNVRWSPQFWGRGAGGTQRIVNGSSAALPWETLPMDESDSYRFARALGTGFFRRQLADSLMRRVTSEEVMDDDGTERRQYRLQGQAHVGDDQGRRPASSGAVLVGGAVGGALVLPRSMAAANPHTEFRLCTDAGDCGSHPSTVTGCARPAADAAVATATRTCCSTTFLLSPTSRATGGSVATARCCSGNPAASVPVGPVTTGPIPQTSSCSTTRRLRMTSRAAGATAPRAKGCSVRRVASGASAPAAASTRSPPLQIQPRHFGPIARVIGPAGRWRSRLSARRPWHHQLHAHLRGGQRVSEERRGTVRLPHSTR